MALTLREVAETSARVSATSSKKAKVALLADLLRRADADEIGIAVGLIAGTPRQGRIGIGWALLGSIRLDPNAPGGELTVRDFDDVLDEIAAIVGEGSISARAAVLGRFLSRADAAETDLIRQLLLGGLRQGALEGMVVEAVAAATDAPAAAVRRALMLAGDLGAVATAAREGGLAALEAMSLQVGRPLRPMLAATSPDVRSALSQLGAVSVEWKLDGARVQVHRLGDDVSIYTRNLNDVTGRLPEVVSAVGTLPVRSVVLDGELIGLSEDAAEAATPRLFQDTISRFATGDVTLSERAGAPPAAPGGASPPTGPPGPPATLSLTPFFFDCLHLDGEDLVDRPLGERLAALDRAVGAFAVPRLITEDPEAADAFAAEALHRGHEGVMVKAIDSPYAAGRRGSAWRKVKPVLTLDLVVLGAEWGHGRRSGWLSNLHLGARDPADVDHFVMVGKTFKGLTDALLRWQTDELQARQVSTEGITVFVRPELVVEIAVDGVQRSARYPGGVALRFARVRRYRPDKSPGEADTIDAVRALLAHGGGDAAGDAVGHA